MKLYEILKKYSLNGDYHNGKKFNNGGTDKNTIHSYVENFYEDKFLTYKDKNVSLLEIGIQGGASLKLWKEYFSNCNKIVGVDISEENVHPNYKNIPGVEYFFGDAYSDEIVNQLDNFDIIIDDGPHSENSQIIFIEKYLPKLNSGGILIIEDVQNINSIDKFIKIFETYYNNDNSDSYYTLETIDLRNKKNRYDDLIFIIEKK